MNKNVLVFNNNEAIEEVKEEKINNNRRIVKIKEKNKIEKATKVGMK